MNTSRKKFSLLILLIGVPGSGKTTWVKEYKKTHPLTYVVSTDEIRKELTGVEQCVDPTQNNLIHETARQRVKTILDDPNSKGGLGPEIIVDSTNVDESEWEAYRKLGSSLMIARIFNISVEDAYKHQILRERKVPYEIIKMKFDTFEQNKHKLPLYFDLISTHTLTN